MNRGLRKLSLVLIVVIAISTMTTACVINGGEAGGKAADTSTTEKKVTEINGVDISKEVHLVTWWISWGDRKPDEQKIIDEANRITKETINATFEYVEILASELQQKYPLMLAAGEKVDIARVGLDEVRREAPKGGLLDMKELLPKVFPEFPQPKEVLNDCLIEGQLVGLPETFNLPGLQAIAIRGDLRKKHGLPEVKDAGSLELFCKTMLEKEPGVLPWNINKDTFQLLHVFARGTGYKSIQGVSGLEYDYVNSKANIKLILTTQTPYQREMLATLKRFNELGFWSKNAYMNTHGEFESFLQGDTYVAGMNTINVNELSLNVSTKHPDWEVEFMLISDKNNERPMPNPGGVTIPKASIYPERALLFIREVYLNKELNQLLEYGIKGEHYNLNDKGQLVPTVAGAERFPADKLPLIWQLRNFEYTLDYAGGVKGYREMLDNIKNITVLDPLYGFSYNTDNIKSELAACKEVSKTYEPMIKTGTIDDIDEFIEKMDADYKAAGVEKVRDELQKQIDGFLKNK